MDHSNLAEQKILKAAESVFYQKGKDGASMQDIANEAGITRTSLNYYYRTKDKLFEAVFRETLSRFVPQIAELINSEIPFREYLQQLVEIVIDTMLENPQIPIFVLQEIASNPGRMPAIVKELGIHPGNTFNIIGKDPTFKQFTIDPRQLLINTLSLCIFPFAAKPLIKDIMYQQDEDAYVSAMLERKKIIPVMLENMLKSSEL